MANTVISIKKSGSPGATPSSLTLGELGLNYNDGKLYYLNSSNTISSIYTANSYSVISANSSLLLASNPNDILTINPAGAIVITTDVFGDTINIGVRSASTSQNGVVQLYSGVDSNSTSLAATASSVNTAFTQANTAFDKTSTVSVTSSSSTANQVLHSFSTTAYRSVKYVVQVTSSTDYQVSEILLIHNGTTAYLTEYALITTNSVLMTYDSDINSGNVRLLMSPTNASSAIKYTMTRIIV
nr:MAG: hypothetical protein [Caudoviricetes sp.]